MEIWKPLPSFGLKHLYKISSFGRIESLNNYARVTNKILTPHENKKRGYWYISCQNKNKRKTFILHRLVAKAFIPNPNNYPCVDHIDFNRSNNKASNLQWCTHAMNSRRTVVVGRNRPAKGELSSMTTLKNKDVLKIRKMYVSGKYLQKEIAKKFGISTCSATLIINRQRWAHI